MKYIGSCKKITFFIYSLRSGGAERVIIQLAKIIQEFYRVEILTIEDKNDFVESLSECKNISIKSLNKNSILGSLWSLIVYIKKSNSSFFISNVWPLTIIGSLMSFLFLKIKFIAIEHCNIFEEYKYKGKIFILLQKISIKILYRFNTKIISVSKGVREALIKVAPTLEYKIKVIYNPVRSEIIGNYHKFDKDLEYLKEFGGMKIIAIGTHNQQKNYPFLINALKEINQRGINFICYIIGEGILQQETERLIIQNDLQEKIKCLGFKKDPREFLVHADLFVLSSIAEGFGLVIVEALQCGITPVVTDCPSGPSEIIGNQFGKLVRINDVENFVENILFAFNNKIDPNLLINRAKDFDESLIANEYLELIKELE